MSDKSQTTNQHYVPVCYLANFGTDGNKGRGSTVYYLNIVDNKCGISGVESFPKEKGFYDIDALGEYKDAFEKMYTDLEGELSKLLKRLIELVVFDISKRTNETVMLSGVEKSALSAQLSMQFTRTRAFRDWMKGNYNRMKEGFAALSKEFLSENAMYAPLPHYMEQPKYLLLRSPHIARNEEVTAFPLKKIGKYRKKYLSHLGDVVMVDSRSLIPERLGGADYDGDYVKTIAEPLILKHIPDSNELPVLHIPAAQGTDADANDWLMRFSTVKNTFSQRIGQISNAALRRGIAAYNENASSDQKQEYRDETEALAILTGLEIDSAKTGVKPNLDAYLNDQSQVKSLFLQYKDKLERLEKRHWYDPTPKEALTEFFAKPEWRRVTSNLERLPYCAWLLKEQTPPHLPEPATDSELFSFARVAGWETQIDPKAISRMKEVITSYETAQTRCRIRYYSAKDYSHLSDIQRILTSRGQEELCDPIKLYEAVNIFSGEHIRSALELVQSQQWQFMTKEDRPLFLKQLYPLLGVGAKRYEDLFCDFRNSGFRILGDVLVDLVRLHRSEEARDHLIRRKDSDLQKRMLIGCKDSRNPQEQILRNCRKVISSKMREYMTDNLTSEEAVMAAVAHGKRRFALEVYPGVVKSLCCTEEKAERRLFQK